MVERDKKSLAITQTVNNPVLIEESEHKKQTSFWHRNKSQVTAGFIGAVCATLVTSFGSLIGAGIQDTLSYLRSDFRVAELEAKLVEAETTTNSYYPLPQTSRSDCYQILQNFTQEQDWKLKSADASSYFLTIEIEEKPIGLRCVGSRWSDTTFVSVYSSNEAITQHNAVFNKIKALLIPFGLKEAILAPNGLDWTSSGPYIMHLEFRVRMSFVDYKNWTRRRTMPPMLEEFLSSDGSKLTCDTPNELYVCTARFPRHALSISAPIDDAELAFGFRAGSPEFISALFTCQNNEIERRLRTINEAFAPEGDVSEESARVTTEDGGGGTIAGVICGRPYFEADDMVEVPVTTIAAYMQYGETGPFDENQITLFAELEEKILLVPGVNKQFGVQLTFKNW